MQQNIHINTLKLSIFVNSIPNFSNMHKLFEMQFIYVFLNMRPVEMEKVKKEIVIPNVESYCIVAV